MRKILLAILVAFASSLNAERLQTMNWAEDVAYFARELPKRHANAFHRITREQFDAAIRQLQADLPSLRDHQVAIRLLQITAQIGDGHTYVRLPASYRVLPVVFNLFEDDLRIVGTTEEHRDLFGARVTAFGATPIARAIELANTTLSQDENKWFALGNLPAALSRIETLHALGIAASLDAVGVSVETAAGPVTRTLRALPRERLQPVIPAGPLPQFRTRTADRFWFEPIAGDANGLYVAFRGYDDFGRNARALVAALDSRKPSYVVIDLRQNGGGDFTKPREQLIPQLRQRGYSGTRLFVITGRRTFSAAMVNAIDFRNLLGATLVGEPPGEKPNSYQENDEMVLPRSKMTISYSTKYYTFLDRDADAVMPDQLIAPTFVAFRDGRDEPLEWILKAIQKI
jgi:hypothetical protein